MGRKSGDGFLRGARACDGFLHLFQEPLNAPFLNGLFSREFLRGKTAH